MFSSLSHIFMDKNYFMRFNVSNYVTIPSINIKDDNFVIIIIITLLLKTIIF